MKIIQIGLGLFAVALLILGIIGLATGESQLQVQITLLSGFVLYIHANVIGLHDKIDQLLERREIANSP